MKTGMREGERAILRAIITGSLTAYVLYVCTVVMFIQYGTFTSIVLPGTVLLYIGEVKLVF